MEVITAANRDAGDPESGNDKEFKGDEHEAEAQHVVQSTDTAVGVVGSHEQGQEEQCQSGSQTDPGSELDDRARGEGENQQELDESSPPTEASGHATGSADTALTGNFLCGGDIRAGEIEIIEQLLRVWRM